MDAEYKELYLAACAARKRAYAPYSGFKTGAALLCADGEIYTGCNIENAAFSPTVCAERTAFFSAVADGKREFIAIAVAGGFGDGEASGACYPCGVCRQVMSEFCSGDFVIVTAEGCTTLNGMLPAAFKLNKN